ncbi:hypothetical protein AGMMS49974_09300 [Deltaproteobacteria bacterium]|nr:hypothetical protein AGMMS49974_09300 [Deltaproteobacteria bacterium]
MTAGAHKTTTMRTQRISNMKDKKVAMKDTHVSASLLKFHGLGYNFQKILQKSFFVFKRVLTGLQGGLIPRLAAGAL